jgi:glycosyltransferase involved in cell wall biosynthesis
MGKPRLLHLFNAFEVGGVERQHMMLVERLAKDYEQSCWSYISGVLQDELESLGVSHLVGNASDILKMAEESDCVVIRTNRYFRQWSKPLSELGVPVLYIRDYLSWYQGNGTYYDQNLDRQAYALADYTMFCGPALRKAAEGMPFKGGEILYNSLDLSRFPMRNRSGMVNIPPRVAMIGNIVPRKNYMDAIHAMHDLLAAGDYELHIGGEFRDKAYVAQVQAAADGLPVVLHGYINDPSKFLADKDVFLMTSIKEGWPVAIMEAMACGLPVIAPNIGDIGTLLYNEWAGLVYPPDEYERIVSLLDDLRKPLHYEEISSRGLERVRQFDIDNAWRQLDRAVRVLIGTRTAGNRRVESHVH